MLGAAAVTRYRTLNEDLENQYTMGHNNYPATIAAAYNILVNFKGDRENGRSVSTPEGGMAFTNVDYASATKPRANGDPEWLSRIQCYKCEKKGHFTLDCPDKKNNTTGDVVRLMVGNVNTAGNDDEESYSDYDNFAFHQSQGHVIKNWILLDNRERMARGNNSKYATSSSFVSSTIRPQLRCSQKQRML
jgi:hypothetical protein